MMMMIWQTHDYPYKIATVAADTPKNLQENNIKTLELHVVYGVCMLS